MDVVVDGHLMMSQDKSSSRATGEQTPQHRRRKDTATKANSPSSYPLSLESTRGIKPRNCSRATSPLPQDELQH
jgi:hypothetical protein